MNLNKLFAVFEQKGLGYIDARVHSGGKFFHASTNYNGRGDCIIVHVSVDGKINIEIHHQHSHYNIIDITEEVCLDKISKAW